MSTPEATNGTGRRQENLSKMRVSDLDASQRRHLPLPLQIGLLLAERPLLQQTLYAGSELKEVLAAELDLDPDDESDKEVVSAGLKTLKKEGSLSYETNYVSDTYKDYKQEEHEEFMLRTRPVLGPKFQNVFFSSVEAVTQKFSSFQE